MTIMTKSEFARKIKRSHQYVTSLIKQERVILKKVNGKEMVEVEASLNKIRETADPANDPANTMPRADGRVSQSVGIALNEADGHTTSNATYQKSRAVKESYAARLRKIEYEQKMGTIVAKEGVEKAAFGLGRILREKLKALPTRLSPRVTIITNQKENFKLLTDEIENVIKEIQSAISEIINN